MKAWDEGQPWCDEVLGILQRNRDWLSAAAAREFPQAVMRPAQATYLAWIDFSRLQLPRAGRSILSGKAKVALSPGENFGAGVRGNFVRLNFATSPAILEQIVARDGGGGARFAVVVQCCWHGPSWRGHVMPDGGALVLRHCDGIYEIRCDGWEAMASRAHRSEEAMARLGMCGTGGCAARVGRRVGDGFYLAGGARCSSWFGARSGCRIGFRALSNGIAGRWRRWRIGRWMMHVSRSIAAMSSTFLPAGASTRSCWTLITVRRRRSIGTTAARL